MLLVFIMAFISCWHAEDKRILVIAFLIPSIVLWFVLGSYNIRLGLYIIATVSLLIASDDYLLMLWNFKKLENKLVRAIALPLKPISATIVTIGFGMYLIFSFSDQINPHINSPNLIFPLNGGLSNLHYYFQSQGQYVYENIYNNPDVQIMAPNPLVKGIFYGHNNLTPNPTSGDIRDIYRSLRKYRPDYIVVARSCGENYWKGVNELYSKRPNLLSPIFIEDNAFGNRLYKVNKHYLSGKDDELFS
jgi:hypothetical protein